MIYLYGKKLFIVFNIFVLSLSAVGQTFSTSQVECDQKGCCEMDEKSCCTNESAEMDNCNCFGMNSAQKTPPPTENGIPSELTITKFLTVLPGYLPLSIPAESGAICSDNTKSKKSDLTDLKIYKTIHSFLI